MNVYLWMCAVVVSYWSFPLISAPQCYHHCLQQCCLCCWFNHRLSMCPHCRKLCVPRWSLSVADRLHKRKATLDQYVNNDDRLVPETCPQCLAQFMHVRHSPLPICLPLCECVCLFLRHMQRQDQRGFQYHGWIAERALRVQVLQSDC